MDDFNPLIAYVEDADGHIFQVIAPNGKEWDEAATAAAIKADDYLNDSDQSPST